MQDNFTCDPHFSQKTNSSPLRFLDTRRTFIATQILFVILLASFSIKDPQAMPTIIIVAGVYFLLVMGLVAIVSTGMLSNIMSSHYRERTLQAKMRFKAFMPKSSSPKKSKRRRLRPSLRYKVLKRDGFQCKYCGRTPKKDGVVLHADHIIPLSAGGTSEIDNLQCLCQDCNLGKSDQLPLDLEI